MTKDLDEIERIREEYRRRNREIPIDFYAFDREANLFALHARERALRDALGSAKLLPLTGRTLLEIGCGNGEWFASFERLGLRQADLTGSELDEGRAAIAHARAPGATMCVGNASTLEVPDGQFDIVFQSTVFSSILDVGLRTALAHEMSRVLKPGGALVWYDFAYDNPGNAAVRGVKAAEIRTLFPRCEWTFARVTLAPPIARRLVPRSWIVAELLQWFRLANTHLFGVGRLRSGQ